MYSRSLFLRLAFLTGGLVLCAQAVYAAEVAIYYDSQGPYYDRYTYSYSGTVNLYESLQSRLENYGHTVTVIDRNDDSSSLDLSSYDMFWDIRAVTPPDANEISEIESLLSNGGYVFLLGENTSLTFADRDAGIISFLEDRGSGDMGDVVSASGPTQFASGFNDNPHDLTGMAFPAAAGVNGDDALNVGANDKGICLTADSSDRCTAIAFERTLTGDAAGGTVVEVFDVNFLQWNYYSGGSPDTKRFLDNLINYSGGQIGVNQVLAGAETVDVGSSSFEISTADAEGEITSNITGTGTVTFNEGSTGVYSGNMSGSAGLKKTGEGTLTLSGTNTHTGGNTISGGTLKLSCNGMSGDVANAAALEMEISSGTCTYAGAISGDGAMVKNGSGILQLTGTSSLSGATSVSAGTLVVNGSIASSPVSLASGTVLKGTGTLGSLSASSGAIIRPGNSIGTLNVAGDFALDAGSTLEVEFNDSSMDKVVATGDVSLSGDVSFVLYGDDGYFTVTQTIVETSGGTLTGEFASIAADNDFTATVNYSGTTATATVSKTLASSTLDAPMSSQAALTQTVAMNMINTLHKASESVIEEPAGFFEIMKFGASSASREGQSGYTSHGVVKNVGGIMNFKGALVGGGLFFSDGKVDRKRYRGADEVDSMGVSVGVRKALAFSRLGEMALNATIGGGRYRFKNHRYVTIDNTPEEGIGDGHGQFSFVSVEGSKTLPFHRYGDTSVSADLTGTWVRHGGWDESGLSQNNALVTKSEATVLTTTAGARHRFSPVYFKNSQAYMVPALNAYYEHAKLIGSKSATVTDGSATYRLKPVMHESPHFGLKGMIDIPLNKLSLAFNAGVQVADKKSSSSFGAFIQIPLK